MSATRYTLDLTKTPQDKKLALVVDMLNNKYHTDIVVVRTYWDDWLATMLTWVFICGLGATSGFFIPGGAVVLVGSLVAAIPLGLWFLVSLVAVSHPADAHAAISSIRLSAHRELEFVVGGARDSRSHPDQKVVRTLSDLPEEFVDVVQHVDADSKKHVFAQQRLLKSLGVEQVLPPVERKALEGSVSLPTKPLRVMREGPTADSDLEDWEDVHGLSAEDFNKRKAEWAKVKAELKNL